MTGPYDLVFVVDLAARGPFLDILKSHAPTFDNDLRSALAAKHMEIETLRVRVVGFPDVSANDTTSISESPFFNLPDQSSDFAAAVNAMRPAADGDGAASSLEALALAIRSEWTSAGTRGRQVIVACSDTAPYPLEQTVEGSRRNSQSALPTTFDELTADWEDQSYMSAADKWIVLIAPDVSGWSDISANWVGVIHFPLSDGSYPLSYPSLLEALVSSI